MNAGQQPLLVLSEDVMRQQGKDAQSNNIDACKKISNAVRTTLGPKGMDKMLVDSIGDITVTNDGVTILDEMEIEHPAAKMMVEVAKTQDEEVGDGTTSAVVLGGELLKKADDLIDQEVHPTIIASGYRQAKERTLEILDDIAEDITFEDEETLQSVANTAMTGKSAETAKKKLAKIAVDAVKQVAVEQENGYDIDHDMIQVEKKTGSSTEQTKLIQGVIVDKEKAHSGMDNKTEDAQIALLDSAIEVQETETSAEIHIDDPNKLQDFIEQEEESLREMVDQVKDAGANVVFCQKGIDDIAQHFFAKEGIFAVRRVKKSDMEKLAKATDANIVTTLTDLEENDLGQAGRVQQRRVAGDSMVFVEECDNAKAVSVLLRGGTDHVVDELERAMEDAIGGVTSALRVGKVVGGGGAAEIELGQELREYADSVGGREQLAINAFAEAVEAVPRTLAENAGLDPIDVLVDLRSQHDKGEQWAGIDVFTGKSEDLFNRGVVEPLQIKTQALQSAAEAAELILRIDDVMASEGGLEADGGGPGGGGPPGGGGMPGGMGGMGGMM